MPWLCSTISMMLGVAINSDQRKWLTVLPAVAMPVYGAPAPNTINHQLPSSKMPWSCNTISMMLGVAIDSDQRKRLAASPIWERFQDTNPNLGVVNACCADAGLRPPSSEHHQSLASFIENALVVKYYFYDAGSGHQFRSKKEVASFARYGDASLWCLNF
ncbi:hypothetical protein MRB53_010992 [Persea americana]|uniref:Uncharacterized protein n=1 Tax=Persea americana TaxID=3435 RepID=A0ACC2LTP3_PERAE|nr:hypothetical protein MRB53_010992 [Persea americana]